MTHPRQTIRESIAERLREKFNNVFITRAKALFEQDLPAVLVYTNSETIKEERWDTDGFGALFRELELCIEAVDTGKDDLENKLDNTAETIEYLLNGWEIPNRKSAVMRFKNTDFDMNIDGNKIYGAIKLTFTLTYQTETQNEH